MNAMGMIRRNRRRTFALPSFAAIFWLCLSARASAQDTYETVKAEDLVKAPQRYWARAIIFQDHVVAPAGSRPVRIEGKLYTPITMRIVGTCYATEDLSPTITSLEAGRLYAFSGMVIQSRGRYYVIVSGAQPILDAATMMRDMASQPDGAGMSFALSAIKPIAEIVSEVQSAHIAYAREKGIPLCELYDPHSVHFPRAMEIMRIAIMNRETENRTMSAEILAQYLIAAIARACTASNELASVADTKATAESPSPPKEAALPVEKPSAAVEATAAPPAVVETSEPIAEDVLESPPVEKRLSFWERWRVRRGERKARQQRAQKEAYPSGESAEKATVAEPQRDAEEVEKEQQEVFPEAEWDQPVLRYPQSTGYFSSDG